jgi:hypothetical protein
MKRSLNDLTAKELFNLKKQVATAKGKAIVLVHPFFDYPTHDTKYTSVIKRILANSKMPVIILGEGRTNLDHVFRALSIERRNNVFSFPTANEDPQLIKHYSGEKPVLERESGELLTMMLHAAGVKKINLGGAYSAKCANLTYDALLSSKRFSKVHLLSGALRSHVSEHNAEFVHVRSHAQEARVSIVERIKQALRRKR